MKYGKILVTVLAVAANSLAWTYEPRGAKFSADGSKLVFLSSSGPDGYDIYTANADGSGKVKLDLPAGLWGEPYFSPDGKEVAFITEREFINGNIFVADVDGKNLSQLTKYGDDPFEKRDPLDERVGVLDEGLTFSPDGRKILYCSAEFGSSDIFTANVDGTGKTRLTAFAGYEESGPVFLPSGGEILFTVAGSGEKAGIWKMNADGSGKKKVPVPGDAELMAVSPDGKKIIAQTIYPCQDLGYFTWGTLVADLDGSSLFEIANLELKDSSWFDLSFSPDGKKILYHLHDAVYIINADGSGIKNLTPWWAIVLYSAFFADSAKIAFVGRTWPDSGFNIYTMDADGSNLKAFKATESMDVYDLVVSPTGDRFLFLSFYEEYPGEREGGYFAVNADGSGLARLTKKRGSPDD